MKVIDIDRDKSSLYEHMGDRYLIVDEPITSVWTDFFEQAHCDCIRFVRRDVRVEGQNIVVNCPLSELQAQIEMIQKNCSSADKSLAMWKARLEQQRQREFNEMENAQIKAYEKFDNLKFC